MNSVENAQQIIKEEFKKGFENIRELNNKEVNKIIDELEIIKEVECLNCSHKQGITKNNIYQDIMGKFTVCEECQGSFDIEI
jgi:hypothetical protein